MKILLVGVGGWRSYGDDCETSLMGGANRLG